MKVYILTHRINNDFPIIKNNIIAVYATLAKATKGREQEEKKYKTLEFDIHSFEVR